MSIVTVGTPGYKEDYADVGARSRMWMVMTPYGPMSKSDWLERQKKEKKKLLAPKPIIHKNTVAKSKVDDTEALKE